MATMTLLAVPKDEGEAERLIVEGIKAFAGGGPDLREAWFAWAKKVDLDREWIEDQVKVAAAKRPFKRRVLSGDRIAAEEAAKKISLEVQPEVKAAPGAKP